MESRYRREDNLVPLSNVSLDRYNHDIQIYGAQIPGTINLEDLKKLGVVRLIILRAVNEIAKKSTEKEPKERLKSLIFRLRILGLDSFADLFKSRGSVTHDKELLCARWRDHVSHNAARLALSQKIEDQFWFQKAENNLVEWRLTALNEYGIAAFMRIHKIQYPMVDENEKRRLKNTLITLMDIPETFNHTIFYKVPYLEGLDVIADGRAHLVAGVAYLTTSTLRSVIGRRFRCHLQMQIKKSLYEANHQRDDPRILDLINHLQNVRAFMKTIYLTTETNIEDLDELALKSFPPCMRKVHEALRKNHHLRNHGRVQYTLFLKAIGVPAERAETFFKKEFTQKMSEKKFNNEYAYYIRHLYGLAGGKRNYTMFDCKKISESSASPDEYHGCPFTQNDIEDLGRTLTRWKIPSDRIAEMKSLTREKKCSEACSLYFENTQGCCPDFSIVNPIGFYRQSMRIRQPT